MKILINLKFEYIRFCSTLLMLCLTAIGGVFLSGCLATKYIERNQYLLNIPTPPTNHNRYTKPVVIINQVTATGIADQLSFLYHKGNNQYITDYYHSFIIAPSQQLLSAITLYCQTYGHFYPVTSAVFNATNLNLQPKLLNLYADYSTNTKPQGVVSLNFLLTNRVNTGTTILLDKTYSSNIPLTTKTTEALLEAWNKGLQIILQKASLDLQQKLKTVK
jgi:hypothetical protein